MSGGELQATGGAKPLKASTDRSVIIAFASILIRSARQLSRAAIQQGSLEPIFGAPACFAA
jgi:hypothetical protein